MISSADRNKKDREYKRSLGACIHSGCWLKAAPGRVRCKKHLQECRDAANARYALKTKAAAGPD